MEKEIKLNIGTDPQMLMPILNSETLSPTIYNNDNDVEFTYLHKHKFPTGTKLYNEYSVTKYYQTPIFSAKGDSSYGDVISSCFVRDETETDIKKLAVIYRADNYDITTEFYDLPLATLATTDVAKNKVKIYYDDKSQVIGSLEKADKSEVYNAVGNLVSVASNTNKISSAIFVKGLYIVKLTTNSVVITSKVIVK
ncbi:T9SS type A sorting domain-containing protein [Soonwooa sp.]|uniref:T9SS type A sorting domain-containing protein n=1 Tax=Soonwooa sp. TaxID=1938592 RepID=UPI002897EAF8|nr:T9SS type A sorting domain-containing protein [Soonwooa sp.]